MDYSIVRRGKRGEGLCEWYSDIWYNLLYGILNYQLIAKRLCEREISNISQLWMPRKKQSGHRNAFKAAVIICKVTHEIDCLLDAELGYGPHLQLQELFFAKMKTFLYFYKKIKFTSCVFFCHSKDTFHEDNI